MDMCKTGFDIDGDGGLELGWGAESIERVRESEKLEVCI